ncbi:glycosyltransferase family 39 protein [Crocosphaera sp. XPORK-15E]|uniref:glycosyltransferase family 39 protein n=1 Tax=Crocosphaera sp. XPORK-15E TaxID=3110247 RepID=UPI002B2178E5|nr:glycosyltransferase family 39 protein [Crocosphaera sp. XPORK-15E]MEA5534299.1 glycosyltransferase family 39 protein [Crocosphaera sp. XPORK-15E]
MLISKSWKFLVIVVLLIGIVLRFVNLDSKVYSADEVRSIMRLSGSTNQQLIEEVFDGKITSVEELQSYQKPTPQKNLSDAVNALVSNPEHPPLYPLLTRFWMQIINIPIAARYISILFSIIVFPSIYWLCLELFESPVVGWVAMCLTAVSPFHILAAQNTTQYSLWTVTITLSSAALINALRLNKTACWLRYAVFSAMGFYTHLYFCTVALSHGLYVLTTEKLRLSRRTIAYLLSSVGSLLLFSPWIYVIVTNLDTIKKNTTYYSLSHTNFKVISSRFLENITNIFVDFHNKTKLENSILSYLILGLIAFSIYFICRSTSVKTWSFVLLLVISNTLFLVIPDSFGASIRALQYRYYLPCFLGIELSVSYLIAHQISNLSLKVWQRQLWQIIFLVIVCLGIISGIFIAQDQDWGIDDQKGTASSQNIQLVLPINQSDRPLVMSATTPSFILALSHMAEPKVKFRLFSQQNRSQWDKSINLSTDAAQFSDIFIIYPNQEFLGFIDQDKQFKRKSVVNNKLYKLEKASSS